MRRGADGYIQGGGAARVILRSPGAHDTGVRVVGLEARPSSGDGSSVLLLRPKTCRRPGLLYLSHLSTACCLHVFANSPRTPPCLITVTAAFLVEAASPAPWIAANCPPGFCLCQHLSTLQSGPCRCSASQPKPPCCVSLRGGAQVLRRVVRSPSPCPRALLQPACPSGLLGSHECTARAPAGGPVPLPALPGAALPLRFRPHFLQVCTRRPSSQTAPCPSLPPFHAFPCPLWRSLPSVTLIHLVSCLFPPLECEFHEDRDFCLLPTALCLEPRTGSGTWRVLSK